MTNAPTVISDDALAAGKPSKRIVLGITGGIAAYKSAELVRLLVRSGVGVTVVMTDAAQQFVTPTTLQALSGSKVFVDLWDRDIPNNMAHIELSRQTNLIVVAPATANFIAKLTCGLADDLLSTLCLARNTFKCPLLVAPAMNREMWSNPATQRNITQLGMDGITVLGPASGEQACGETGEGRMLEADELFGLVMAHLQRDRQHSAGSTAASAFAFKKALVTAGPTFEAIDAVRGITNASSGKMGYAIASALRLAGADVTLVSGPTHLVAPKGIKVVNVKSSSQMLEAVDNTIESVDVFFAVAAVADYTPKSPNAEKIKKSAADLTISLVPTVDILAKVAARRTPPFCVGFAAESANVAENAAKKRLKKRIPMIVANHADSAIGADDNEVIIIDDFGEHPIPRASKSEIASKIVSHAARLFAEARQSHPPGAPGLGLDSIHTNQNHHAASNP